MTLRGLACTATGVAAAVAGTTLALSAPGWALVCAGAVVAGAVTGLMRP